MTWLTPAATMRLPRETAVVVEPTTHTERLRGRIVGRVGDELQLETFGGRQRTLHAGQIHRARLVSALFEDAAPVVLVGTPAASWRAGVVRSEGRRVLVEQMDGSFAWFDESELERPEDSLATAQSA